jgi:glycosidase
MRCTRLFLSLLIFALLIGACQPRALPWTDTKSERWSDDAVFYQVFVRSFYDSDGDGVGDFKGLTAKLDYLNDGKPETKSDLGVTGLWLMPIFPSPSYHGYDVTDYYDVNPKLGTMDDFKAFLDAAHSRGIRVIIDFVINHTSQKHPWFRASALGEAPYKDFYLWSDTDPGYSGPWNQAVWHEWEGRYYYGVFTSEMPDLNYANPAVTAEIEKVATFWLKDVGVDGFRVDGAKHLIEEGQAQENTPATHAWFKDFAGFYRGVSPEALVVGEIWSPSEDAAPYVNNGELDLVFNFPLADDFLAGATFRDGRRVGNSLIQQQRIYETGRYASFLSNHDQTRAMTKMGGEVTRAKAAASMLLTAPGTPFLYYGEEIGMTGDKPDPNLRTPMQWSGEAGAGFSTGKPWKEPTADYTQRNVAGQEKDPASLLNHYRELIRIRSEHYALRSGEFVQVISSENKVYAALRAAEKEAVLVLVNTSNEPAQGITLRWSESPLRGSYTATLLMGSGAITLPTLDENGGTDNYQPITAIPANSTVIIQLRNAAAANP